MKKCNSCNIKFNIDEKHCPLCQNILNGKSKEILFPKNIRYKTNTLILKIVLFSSITLFLVTSFIELMIISKLNISLYIALSLITNYVILYFIFKYRQNIYKMVGKYGVIIVFLLTIWFIATGKTKIINYIIPTICLAELLFNFVVGIILRRNYLIKYSGQILMNIFLLIYPMIFVFLNLTTNNIMPYICSLFSIITTTGLLIFFENEIKEELSKIFNPN